MDTPSFCGIPREIWLCEILTRLNMFELIAFCGATKTTRALADSLMRRAKTEYLKEVRYLFFKAWHRAVKNCSDDSLHVMTMPVSDRWVSFGCFLGFLLSGAHAPRFVTVGLTVVTICSKREDPELTAKVPENFATVRTVCDLFCGEADSWLARISPYSLTVYGPGTSVDLKKSEEKFPEPIPLFGRRSFAALEKSIDEMYERGYYKAPNAEALRRLRTAAKCPWLND
jgi:hypothetical protein